MLERPPPESLSKTDHGRAADPQCFSTPQTLPNTPKHSQTLPNTPKHSQTLPNIPKLGHSEIWHPFWDTLRSGILPIILKNLTQPSQRQSGGAATAVLTVPII